MSPNASHSKRWQSSGLVESNPRVHRGPKCSGVRGQECLRKTETGRQGKDEEKTRVSRFSRVVSIVLPVALAYCSGLDKVVACRATCSIGRRPSMAIVDDDDDRDGERQRPYSLWMYTSLSGCDMCRWSHECPCAFLLLPFTYIDGGGLQEAR